MKNFKILKKEISYTKFQYGLAKKTYKSMVMINMIVIDIIIKNDINILFVFGVKLIAVGMTEFVLTPFSSFDFGKHLIFCLSIHVFFLILIIIREREKITNP